MTYFASKLFDTRREKKLTQKELADLLNVKQTTVSTWETGKVVPPIPMVFNIANVLNVPAIELLELMQKDFSKEPA